MGDLLRQGQSEAAAAISREALRGVHVAHCCWLHGCKYGADWCPVTDPAIQAAQSHPCEQCDDEIREGWTLIKGMNAVYDAGRAAGQAEGARHGFAQGSFRGFVQGRTYAETGRLEPMSDAGTAPWGEELEVTDEMVKAFGDAWEAEDRMVTVMGEAMIVPGSRRRAGLRAVLAVLRQDLS